ncbi:interferon-induced, double-stranded RNA-activated protein kinase-like isoform X2 [Bufo gargarizans]|uniref:interferon-induced, double-stranded RNA-activated protein kinase-like isoform X2 n=1 Tax=Bufo gargarizans TaxID=30331 RepID=UPI001CF1C2FF|nr:interferon-induced, double-stranded RNA-activated protein kinase-like isoform X2 [Bufo gargarizans]
MADKNYKGLLIRHCDLSGLTFRFEECRTGPSHDPRFTSYVFINEEKLGEGQDKTKRAAENLACKMALLALQNQDQENRETAQAVGNSASPGGPVVGPVASPSLVNGAASNIVVDQNYVGLFNEFCQRNELLNYSFENDRRGPSHIPEFVCSVVISQRKFPEATGKSKKEAKKNAAYLALKVLKQEYPGDLQLRQVPGLDDVEEAKEDSTESVESAQDSSSSDVQRTESEPLQSESDSQVTFHSSATGTPSVPSRPHRRIELAANFRNCQPTHGVTTENKTFLQDFDSITRLDSGGYGTVYKARKKIDKKYYVVKKVKRLSEKDENEIQTLANLGHKNIVRYYHSWTGEDIFTDNGSGGHKVESLFIQMELCANGTLENWISKREIVDKLKSLHIFRQIIDGVEYIHSNNLIHRDLKPANILFAEDMTVKIADFGLVTPISGKDKIKPLLRTVGQGTESYMAPEQENDIYENEVDIYPLGLILVELFWKFDIKYKYKEWEKLRNAELPPKFVQQFPSETHRTIRCTPGLDHRKLEKIFSRSSLKGMWFTGVLLKWRGQGQ